MCGPSVYGTNLITEVDCDLYKTTIGRFQEPSEMLLYFGWTIVCDGNIFCNINHITIQIDEILGDSSGSEDGSDEMLEVYAPMVNQLLDTQNINNEREDSTTTNNNNRANNQHEFTNWKKRTVNAHMTNFESQNSSTTKDAARWFPGQNWA